MGHLTKRNETKALSDILKKIIFNTFTSSKLATPKLVNCASLDKHSGGSCFISSIVFSNTELHREGTPRNLLVSKLCCNKEKKNINPVFTPISNNAWEPAIKFNI